MWAELRGIRAGRVEPGPGRECERGVGGVCLKRLGAGKGDLAGLLKSRVGWVLKKCGWALKRVGRAW